MNDLFELAINIKNIFYNYYSTIQYHSKEKEKVNIKEDLQIILTRNLN